MLWLQCNRTIDTVSLVFDMEGIGMRHLWKPGKKNDRFLIVSNTKLDTIPETHMLKNYFSVGPYFVTWSIGEIECDNEVTSLFEDCCFTCKTPYSLV